MDKQSKSPYDLTINDEIQVNQSIELLQKRGLIPMRFNREKHILILLDKEEFRKDCAKIYSEIRKTERKISALECVGQQSLSKELFGFDLF